MEAKSVSHRSPSPTAAATSNAATTPQTSQVLDSWFKNSKPVPLNSSLDEMLNNLDVWDQKDTG